MARLHSTDVLCTQSDLEFLDSIWNCGTYVIAELWANETMPIPDTVAKADWIILNVIPNIELVMRFALDGPQRISQVAAARCGANLRGICNNAERRRAQAKWFEDSCLVDLLPANTDVLEEIATQAAEALVRRTQEVSIEIERKHS